MKHRKHVRVEPNYDLRNELIRKGFIIPWHDWPAELKRRGFLEAAAACAQRRRVAL